MINKKEIASIHESLATICWLLMIVSALVSMTGMGLAAIIILKSMFQGIVMGLASFVLLPMAFHMYKQQKHHKKEAAYYSLL